MNSSLNTIKPGIGRARAFRDLLFHRLKQRSGRTVNLSSGNPAFEPYNPAVIAVGKAVLGRDVTLYKSKYGDQMILRDIIPFFEDMGIQPENESLCTDNLIPGLGITNLHNCLMEKIADDTRQQHPDKKPVILMTAPSYGLFTTQPEHEGIEIETVPLSAEHGYQLQADDLSETINKINSSGTHKVVAYYNINPHNPLGTVMEQDNARQIAGVIQQTDILAIDDMAYWGMEYGGHKAFPLAAIPGMFERTVTFVGLSKPFCVPDLRSAVACAPKQYVNAMGEIIDRHISSVPTTSQIPLRKVLTTDPDKVEERQSYLDRNKRRYLKKSLLMKSLIMGADSVDCTPEQRQSILEEATKALGNRPEAMSLLSSGVEGLSILNPDLAAGYFHVLKFEVDGQYYGNTQINNSFQFAAALVDQGKTLVLPSFCCLSEESEPMTARATFGTSNQQIVRAVHGMKQTIKKLSATPSKTVESELAAYSLQADGRLR